MGVTFRGTFIDEVSVTFLVDKLGVLEESVAFIDVNMMNLWDVDW